MRAQQSAEIVSKGQIFEVPTGLLRELNQLTAAAHGVVANESPANVATLAAAQKAFASRTSVVRKELADKSKMLKDNPWPLVLEALDKLGDRIVNELQANNQQFTGCLQTSTEKIIAVTFPSVFLLATR
ncbi:hypothetical protein BP6252_13376 [Coleophoma cylindrospora]|uniref:Uncharacterized protein n=1 Tax=Coleophoma cylindrospora TaxID=1849047 RepID=A0A3D8QB77_9HELO|nr:hypothetical protein BP6252_13376 [Coleophoma cylindrospora]